MIFVGYESGSKAWRLYDPTTGRVTVSCDVVFDEAGQWEWNEHNADDNTLGTDSFTIEYSEVYVPTTTTLEPGNTSPHTPLPTASPSTRSSMSQPRQHLMHQPRRSNLSHPRLMMTWTWTPTTTTPHFASAPSTPSSPLDPRHQA